MFASEERRYNEHAHFFCIFTMLILKIMPLSSVRLILM